MADVIDLEEVRKTLAERLIAVNAEAVSQKESDEKTIERYLEDIEKTLIDLDDTLNGLKKTKGEMEDLIEQLYSAKEKLWDAKLLFS